MRTQVRIARAGPTGLTLAVDLGMRGIRCTLIEQKEAPQFLPKMERVNARSMEIYRRMGLAEKIRDAGLPRDVPMDVFIVLSLAEPPLLHLPYPSVAEAEKQAAQRGEGKALAILAARLGRAVYHMLRKREAFDEARFWEGETRPATTGSSSLSRKEARHAGD